VNNARANAGLSATVLFAVQQESTPSLRTICEGLFQVFKPLGRGELLIIKYCLVLPKRSPVSLKEGTFLRARHGFPLPCMKEEPAGLGGLDGSLVHLQFTPGEVSPALTRLPLNLPSLCRRGERHLKFDFGHFPKSLAVVP
jgi:hypothetical protein